MILPLVLEMIRVKKASFSSVRLDEYFRLLSDLNSESEKERKLETKIENDWIKLTDTVFGSELFVPTVS